MYVMFFFNQTAILFNLLLDPIKSDVIYYLHVKE